MVNIERNSVSNFQYSSTLPASGEVLLALGSANNTTNRHLYVTDIKMTTASAVAVKFYIRGAVQPNGKPINIRMPANSSINYSFEMPYEFNWMSSTAEQRPLVGSASDVGVKYIFSGYREK